LDELLNEELLTGVPVLVFANKQDIEMALDAPEVSSTAEPPAPSRSTETRSLPRAKTALDGPAAAALAGRIMMDLHCFDFKTTTDASHLNLRDISSLL